MTVISPLEKPGWLREWLGVLHFSIFTWYVDVGGPIEIAIDWAIGGVNAVISWVNYVVNWIEQAYDWVRDRVMALVGPWLDAIISLGNTVATWWDRLGSWWAAQWDTVSGWIQAALQPLRDLYQGVVNQVNQVWVAVGNFFTVTLPSLASKLDVENYFRSFTLQWRDLFNWWGDRGHDVTSFFTDPLQWVYDRLDEFFARFW